MRVMLGLRRTAPRPCAVRLPAMRAIRTSAQAAVGALPAGCTIVSGPGCATPTTLLRALGELADRGRGWTLESALLLGDLPFVDAVREGRLAHTTWHVVAGTRELVADGHADFIPLRGSEVPARLERRPGGAAFVRVSPPGPDGQVSLGTSVGFTRTAIATAAVVIGEVDPKMPRTHGESLVPVEAFAALVESEDPTPEYASAEADDVTRRISEHLLDLLPKDPVLQMGIGGVPEALTGMLVGADLGAVRLLGLGTDPMIDLFDAGVLRTSDVVPSPAVMAVELMGTRRMLDFVDDQPAIGVYPVGRAGDPRALARIPRLVSVLTALEVDLWGQVNLEQVAGQQITGLGGSLDFNEGARGSDGGVRIVALRATARGRSRIVSRLGPGTPVTLGRHAVDHVVTEYGVASIGGLSLRERAEALIAIAAPEHRDELAAVDEVAMTSEGA